jgi:hypothetical protein
MSILNNATEHYKAQLSGDMRKIEVPEWESTIYFKPITSLADEQKVVKLHSEGKIIEGMIESLIQKACDADGKKLFKSADRVTMMHEVDPEVLMRIAGQINNTVSTDAEELGN